MRRRSWYRKYSRIHDNDSHIDVGDDAIAGDNYDDDGDVNDDDDDDDDDDVSDDDDDVNKVDESHDDGDDDDFCKVNGNRKSSAEFIVKNGLKSW